ncbi:MAG: restriction endonuclease subunit S [bacterium]|nr:restriction endonuclease subunit S [bacterium]
MTTQVSQKWNETTLGDICDQVPGIIQTGPFGSQLHESDYSQDGIPVVMPKDIIDGKIETNGIARVSNEHVIRLQKHKLKAGDIVYGRRGDIGRQALVRTEQDGWLCGTGCLRISLSDKIINPKFLHYYLRDEATIKWISNQAIGATMPNLNTAILRSVPIRIPNISVQQRIASVLSIYDDLNENNIRRIRILEQMAQVIYTEWFVNFRFPDYEKIKSVNNKIGRLGIPEGWEYKNLTETQIFKFCKNRIKPFSGEKLYLDTSSVDGINISKEPILVTLEDIPSRAQFQPTENSIWFARMSNTYKVLVFTKNCSFEIENYILSSGMLGIETEEKYLGFLFFTINSSNFHQLKDQHATGSTQVSLTNEGFQKIKVIIPPIGLIQKYSEVVSTFIDQILLLQKMNQRLKNSRDLLISKLVTGEIKI